MSDSGGGSAPPVVTAAAVTAAASPVTTPKIGAKANWGKVRYGFLIFRKHEKS